MATRRGAARPVVVASWAVVLLVLAAGCFSHGLWDPTLDLSEPEVIGAWRNTDRAGLLVLAEDGTFTASNVPHEMFSGFTGQLPAHLDPAQDIPSGAGLWSLETARWGYEDDPRNRVQLQFRDLDGGSLQYVTSVRAERDGEALVLAYYVGDPDLRRRYLYEQCADPCPATSPADRAG